MASDPYVDAELGVSPPSNDPTAEARGRRRRRRRRKQRSVAFADHVVTDIRAIPTVCDSDRSRLFYTRAECRGFRGEYEREKTERTETDGTHMTDLLLLLEEEIKREERARAMIMGITPPPVSPPTYASVGVDAPYTGGAGGVVEAGRDCDDDDGGDGGRASDIESPPPSPSPLPSMPMPVPCGAEAADREGRIGGRKRAAAYNFGSQALHVLGVSFVLVCCSYRAMDGEWPLGFGVQ